MSKEVIKVALAQIAPIWLNKEATIFKTIRYIEKAGKNNCSLVTFGEAFVPGYPFWLSLTDGARFNSKTQKEIHAHYVKEAVNIENGDLQSIADSCKKNNISCVLGIIELAQDRGGHSIYCSLVYLDAQGRIKNVHRKMMPTYEERLSWAQGDGHGLRVQQLEAFTVGGLNCWENWMPLARTALYGMGEDLHVAIWPGGMHNTHDLTRFIAKEGRSYVISVSGILRKSDITDAIPHADLIRRHAEQIISNGGSCISGPDGKWIIEPTVDKEVLLIAEIDHARVREERQNFDPSGHYSRPDITKLSINRSRDHILDIED